MKRFLILFLIGALPIPAVHAQSIVHCLLTLN